MKKNEGVVDQAIRIILGAAVLALAFVGPKTHWGYLGLIPLVTGLMAYCPLYSLIGVNTCRRK